jgi:membrane protein required for colicin V production
MTAYDFIFIIPLIYALYTGFTKGFVMQIASLAALVLGLIAAFFFSDYLAGVFLAKWGMSYRLTYIMAFSATFILVLAAIYFLGFLLTRVVKAAALGWLNRLAGVCFAVLKITLILSTLLYIVEPVCEKYKVKTYEKVQHAYLYPFVKPLTPFIIHCFDKNDDKKVEAKTAQTGKKNSKAE